jgi:2-hydroxychromene-2-carboxylate isomerase
MAAAQIDFWFTMGSTYSFLTVMRLAEIAMWSARQELEAS